MSHSQSSTHSAWRQTPGASFKPLCRRCPPRNTRTRPDVHSRARKMEPAVHPHPQTLLASNPFTPTSTLAQAIMHASPLLSELIVVREWLHETAPPPQHPEVTTGYWKFTKHNVMQGLRTGAGPREGLVKELDPDAVNRGDGRTLAADDAVRSSDISQNRCPNCVHCRHSKNRLHRPCIRLYALGGWTTRSSCVGGHISLGRLRASGDLFYSSGER